MGEANARRVFMSARMFDAREARELGLVAKVVSADALDAAIVAETKPYLSCSPKAVKEAKALIAHIGGNVDEAMMAHTAARLADCWEGDAQEGVKAFFEKRAPAWKKER
jgi:methylglutaconyl-CoA hydratase